MNIKYFPGLFDSKNNLLIGAAIFLFPILVVSASHSSAFILLALLIIGLLFGWSELKSIERLEKLFLSGFVLFFCLVSISLFNTQDVDAGIKELGRYLHFPLIIPMYLLLKKLKLETGMIFLSGMLVASVVLFGFAIYQVVVLEMPRALGAYNALIFGNISMLIAVLEFCALITLKLGVRQNIIILLAVIMALSASVLSGSKGAWLLLPVIAVYLLWIYRKEMGNKVLIMVGLSVVALLWLTLNLAPVKSRLDIAISDYQQYVLDPTKARSTGARLEMWRDSIEIWKANPIIGTGIGDFKRDRQALIDQGKSNLVLEYGHAHSIYFDILAKAGTVGILALLGFVLFVPFCIFRLFWLSADSARLKFYALSGMTTIIAFAVFGLSEGLISRNVFVRTYLITILVFISSLVVIKASDHESEI